MKKFWMVVRLRHDNGDLKPAKRYATEHEAKLEAEDLCKIRNDAFGILELTEVVTYPKPVLKWKKV